MTNEKDKEEPHNEEDVTSQQTKGSVNVRVVQHNMNSTRLLVVSSPPLREKSYD
jgi:hypothetical protein